MPLARFDAPFEHPDWIFEPKMDGFRAVAYVEGDACRLVSRNRNAFKTFESLAQAIAQDLAGRSAPWSKRERWLFGDVRPRLVFNQYSLLHVAQAQGSLGKHSKSFRHGFAVQLEYCRDCAGLLVGR